MDDQVPSIGRIVHYVSYGTPGGEYAPEHRAAIITAVDEGSNRVSLCVLNPTGMFFDQDVPWSGSIEPFPGSWHWPERV
jgi:hypothetical protein